MRSSVAQWKRGGLITHRSYDRNIPLLIFFHQFYLCMGIFFVSFYIYFNFINHNNYKMDKENIIKIILLIIFILFPLLFKKKTF